MRALVCKFSDRIVALCHSRFDHQFSDDLQSCNSISHIEYPSETFIAVFPSWKRIYGNWREGDPSNLLVLGDEIQANVLPNWTGIRWDINGEETVPLLLEYVAELHPAIQQAEEHHADRSHSAITSMD
jgi:hypothetical protein